jgi:hypothetical protein
VLRQSEFKCWLGLFPLKEDEKPKRPERDLYASIERMPPRAAVA